MRPAGHGVQAPRLTAPEHGITLHANPVGQAVQLAPGLATYCPAGQDAGAPAVIYISTPMNTQSFPFE